MMDLGVRSDCSDAEYASEVSWSTQSLNASPRSDGEMSPERAQRFHEVLETKRANAAELDAAAKHGGDELWEENADSDSDGDLATPEASDGEGELRPLPPVPAWPPWQKGDNVAPISKLIAVPLPTVRVRAVAATPHQLASQKQVWKRRSSTQLSSSQPRGLAALVGHLRSDNRRLWEALSTAQQDAEAHARDSAGRPGAGGGVDFAHLLALVKELGDGLGGLGQEEVQEMLEPAADGAENVLGTLEGARISTPRTARRRRAAAAAPSGFEAGEETEEGALPNPPPSACGPLTFSLCTRAEDEAIKLRAALKESQREAAALQAQLAERETMLKALRCPALAA